MTEQELSEKLRVMIRGYLRHYTDSARDSSVYANEVLSLITQYGDTREREGRESGKKQTLNLLEANLSLANWGDDISARKLWSNMNIAPQPDVELKEEV